MDDVARNLREMLNDRVAAMPAAYDAPPVLLKRARRRRATKLTALSASIVVVIGGGVGVIAGTTGDGPRRVVTTTPTSTLSRPGLSTLACAKDYPNNIRGTRLLPPTRPQVPTAGDPAILSTMVWFAESIDPKGIVLGPASWSCHLPARGSGVVVYDPKVTGGAVPAIADAPLSLANDYLWGEPTGPLLACSVFDDPAVMERVDGRDISGCGSERASRRTVTRVDEHVATFVDGDGSRGMGWLQLPSSGNANDGVISVLTCRPTEDLTADACDTIVAEYSARLVADAKAPTVICPATSPLIDEQPTLPSAAPTTGIRVDSAGELPLLQYFSGGYDQRLAVLGPDTWSCLGRLADSDTSYTSLVVYDPNDTPGRVPAVGSAPIAIEHEVWINPSGARLLCSVFEDASCRTPPSPGRTVTRVSEDVATFVDANGDRGAGWMIPPVPELQEAGRISVLVCRPSANLTVATCDAIVADYAARLSDGNPPPS